MPTLDEIAAFYDIHPYPPPVDDLEATLTGWDGTRRRIEHFRRWPTHPYDETRRILIAGCGTSQAARWAVRYPHATVVGIDVSPASLEAEQALIDRHQIDNLELRESPVEEVEALGGSFDQIVCTGVLHHLAEPTLGLQALRGVLAPEGALQLMVYASFGRFGISMMRDFSRRLSVATSTEEIDHLVQTLRELPMGHPMSHILREAPDFGDRDALADALLNPRETSYTVPELFGLLDDANLRFGRWVRQAPYRPQCGIMSRLPHRERIAALDEVDQYAAMELFRGTIARHSLIAYRVDSPLPAPTLTWTEDAWPDYIPIVPSTVVVVRERLPSGAAAALVNQAHVDRDLVCFLTLDELDVFGAIDGASPIGEVQGATRHLLERLWMHDLVMIDATGV